MENEEAKLKNARINLEQIGLKQIRCSSDLKELIGKGIEFMDKTLHIKMTEPYFIRFVVHQFCQKLISGGLELSSIGEE